MKAKLAILCLLLLSEAVRAPDGDNEPETGEKKEVNIESVDEKLDDVVKRLYNIEDKVDHLLFHHSHDVTPHSYQFTPFGPLIVPEIKNPKSAHTQMKTHDILRSGMGGGYPMGFYGMGGQAPVMPQMPYQGFPPLF